MTTLYFILFVISFFYLCLLLFRFKHNISVYYVLLAVCILLINYGYWQIGIAENLEEALAACRVSYLALPLWAILWFAALPSLQKQGYPLRCNVSGLA